MCGDFFKGVNKVNKKEKIEMIRNILNNATDLNITKEIILKISQKLDKHVIEYYQEYKQHMDDY